MTRINFQNVKYHQYVGKGAFPRASFARDLRFLAKNALPDTASYFKDVGGNLLVSILKQKKVIEQNSIGPLSTLQFNQILVQPTAGLLSAIADEFNRSNERPKEVFLAVSNKNKGKAPKLVIDHLESETAKKVQLKADKGNTFQKEQEKLFNETISETIKKMSLSQNGLAAEEIDEKALEALIDNKLVIPVAYFDAYGLSVRYFTKLQCDTELKDSLATFIEGEAWPCLAAKGIDLDKHPQLIPVKALTDDDEKQLVTVYYSKEVFSSLRKEAFGSNNLSRFFVLIRTPEDHNHWIQAQDADELVSRRSLYYALDNSVLFKGEGEFVVHARDSSNYVQEIFAHRLDYLIKIFQKQRPFNIKIDNPENALIKKCAGLAIASHLGQKIELVDEYVLGHLFATATKAAEWGVSHHAVCAALLHKMSADQLAKLHQEIDPDDAAKITGLINKLNQLERIPFWYGAKVDSHYVQNAIHIRDQNLADLDDLLLFLSDKLDKTKRMALHQNKKNNLYAWQLISIIIEASLLLATIAGIRDLKKPYEELLDAAFAVFRPQEYRRLKKERDACLHRSPEKLTSYLENIKNIFADPQGEVFWRIKGLFSCYVKLHERKKVFPTVASLPDLIAFTVLRERPFSCPEEVEAFIDRGLESSRRIDIESTKKMRKDERYRTDCHARTYMWHVYVIDKHGRRIEFQVGPPSQYKIMVYGELRHWKRAMEKRMRILLSYLVENKTEHAEKGRLREAKKEARGDLEEMLENQIIDEGYYNALANFLGKNPLVDFTHLRDNSQQYTIVTCLTRDWQFQTKRLLSEFNNKKPTIEDLAATHGIDMLGEDFYEAESGILQMDDEGLFVANYKNVVSGEELVSGRIYRFKSKIENGIENQPLSVEGRAALLSKVQRYRTMVYLLIRKEHVNKLKKIGKPRLVELENEHKLSPQKIMELLNMEEDELCAALSQPMLFDLASKRLAELLARESKNLLN